MSLYPQDYEEKVLDDIKNNVGIYTPVHSSILRRIVTRKVPIGMIHPNPIDEFSDSKIGPNFGIVGDYVHRYVNDSDFNEPLIVERLSNGEYMLLNGHHRWLAANRLGKKSMPVQLVDVVTEESIYEAIRNSKNNMCVSFDLDEVLLTDGAEVPLDKEIGWPLNKIYKKYLRKNASVLINDLRSMGFDVWIYTGEFYSVEYIKLLLSLHNTKVDGIINGMAKRKNSKAIQEIFAKNYKLSVHIDNDSVICVDTQAKDYEIKELKNNPVSWASDVMIGLKSMDKILALSGDKQGE